MKKNNLVFALLIALTMTMTACGKQQAQNAEETPVTAPAVTSGNQTLSPSDGQQAEISVAEDSVAGIGRQDGERFESMIILEGMEEPVHYEHAANQSAGFEMDYDYEFFTRRSEADRESFLSVWDDPGNPENYLEVRHDPGDAQAVADTISASLSAEYDIQRGNRELENTGSCIWIEASVIKNTDQMAEHLQTVYIIPAPEGCCVATVHSYIAESEGFSRRFAYMLNTLSFLGQ